MINHKNKFRIEIHLLKTESNFMKENSTFDCLCTVDVEAVNLSVGHFCFTF